MTLPTLPANIPWKWIGAGLAALILIIAIPAFIDRAFDDASDKGKLEERNEQLETVIQNKKDSDNASEEIEQLGPVGDRVRYDQCLRTARTPENCKRWLPDVQED